MSNANFYRRILRLSVEQRRLLKEQLVAMKPQKEEKKERKQIVAYVKGKEYLSATELRAYVKEQLPDYMLPNHFVLIDEMPRLPNGKINEKALSELSVSVEEEEGTYVAPTTKLEQELANIWEEILGFAPIGIHDNFFEIGGDSILSIQIVAKARGFGIKLAANQLFEYQTIAALATIAETTQENKIDNQDKNAADADFSESSLNQSDLEQLLDQLG